MERNSTNWPNTRLEEPALAALRSRFAGSFSEEESVLSEHTHTLTWIPPELPSGVVFCRQKQDVLDVLQIARQFRIPVIPFGAGSSLEGQVNAPFGGLSVDLRCMNRIIEISPKDMYVVVEPGLTHETLNDSLASHNLFFSVDPGTAATLGGMASTRASGTNSVRYGTMRENTLSLEVALPTGGTIRTGTKARKSAAGLDLTRLFVGSEGTLGVITELTLRVFPLPSAVSGGRCVFPTIAAAAEAVIVATMQGLNFAKVELLDSTCVMACNKKAGLSLERRPTLFFEFNGEIASVNEDCRRLSRIAEKCGGSSFCFSSEATKRDELWAARRNAWWAIHEYFPGKTGVTTDICVPISRLAECIETSERLITELRLDGVIVGHVGDGNFHTLVMLDLANHSEVAATKELLSGLSRIAIDMGGTCSGEHGIGQGKVGDLQVEHGDGIAIMRNIKNAIDPENIMNPGKMFETL